MNIINHLNELIAFQTVTNDLVGGEECFRYIRKYLSDYQLDTKILRSNSFPSLVATTMSDSKKPKVLLQAHLDVVPAKETCFKMTEKNDKLYGRGVFDMKFAAACYLQLVEDLKNELSDYDFGLMFTSDEEIGGNNGVRMLLDKGYSADVVVIPDAGDNWEIEVSCNGVWIVELKADGRTAHGSRPWEGENAITHLIQTLAEIEKLFGKSEAGKNSLTISRISGGQMHNQVPDQATATLDMRFVNKDECRRFQTKIKALADKNKIQVTTTAEIDCIETDIKQPEVASFIRIAERIRGKPIGQSHSLGSSDAYHFCDQNIPTILMRPDGGGAHSDNEWIDKAGLLQYYEVLKAYVTETAKIK